MLQTQSCVVVRCDQCGDGPFAPGSAPHWPTEAAALAALAAQGWEVDGPRLLCSCCGAVLRCEAAGHEFTAWRRCRCEQLVPAHRPGPSGLCGTALRYCLRCALHESRPAADLAAVLTCADCDTTYQPTAEAVARGRLGCPDPDCGGWTFSTAPAVPTTTGYLSGGGA